MAAKPPGAPPRQNVEVEVSTAVYQAALDVAVSRGEVLAEVGRVILRNASKPEYAFLLKNLPPPPKCGAPTQNGERGPCERWPEKGTNRCRFHGAADAEKGEGPDRKTFRFGMLASQYQTAKETVGGAGQSVARWIEYGLDRYGDPDAPGTL